MATVQMTTVETIADELGKHEDSHANRDWGVDIYCTGCDWNCGIVSRQVFDNDAQAFLAYDRHLTEAIAYRLWGTK